MFLRLIKQYDVKSLSTVVLATILLGILSFWSYKKGSLLVASVAAILTLWGFMILVGHFLSPVYLQREITRFVRKNGGRIEYQAIVDHFTSISKERKLPQDVVPGLLENLQSKGRLETVEGIVHLIQNRGQPT